jgi:hypothetical protein
MAMDDARTNCPSDAALIRFFSREAGRAEIEALADHVRLCPRCRDRFEALRLVGAEVLSRREEFLGLAGKSLREIKRAAKSTSPRGLRRWAPNAAAALLTVAAAIAAFLLILKPPAQDGTLRGPASAHLRLISPVGRLAQAPTVFRWSEVPGADSYFFELIEDTLETIVPLTDFPSTSCVLPPRARAKMHPGRTYIWSVEARSDDGFKIESTRQSFIFSGN